MTDTDLEAYLDEALPAAEMAVVELALRQDKALLSRLSAINARRDTGLHSLGEVWRRARLTCPTREQLGGYLLGVLDDGQSDHLKFHLEVVGCRYCQANFVDLKEQQSGAAEATTKRRRKYFQSSAGYLGRESS
jgi:hypothetical protein